MNSRYLPHTERDIAELLQVVGVSTIDQLFADIPSEYRLNGPLAIPKGTSEIELKRLVDELASKNKGVDRALSFLGAGAYSHYSPHVLDTLVSRGEFLTAYTPYQPEVSQGTLQAIFEYQTLISALLQMDVSNASNYDGSTALAEAVFMAERLTGKKTIAYSAGLHPEYLAVLKTYVKPRDFTLIEIPLSKEGQVDLGACEAILTGHRLAALVIQHPNCLGSLEEMALLSDLAHRASALSISVSTDITVFGLLEPPGALGVDIAVAEGQGLGLPVNFGGPYLGVFATRKEHIRKMPGRLVGRTRDSAGRVAYTLTLSTREQHIRREKATSNICTNQGLCALAATIYLGLMGKEGIVEVGEHCTRRAHGLAKRLVEEGCGRLAYRAPFFHEFVLQVVKPASRVVETLSQNGIVPGFDLGRWNTDWSHHLLVNVTEMHSDLDCQRLGDALKKG